MIRGTFGLRHLRPGQFDVIRNVMEGVDTLATMPTGAGKSLCYQVPALLLEGRTLVVSPLIALMKDQCDRLEEAGVVAVQLNSAMGAGEIAEAEAAVSSGAARVVFSTPERLADSRFRELLKASPTSLLVIDEAHVISQWGHDFRPSFLELENAVSVLGRPTLLALTATASDEVADDIANQLGAPGLARISTGVYRPNLRYTVEQVADDDAKLARLVALVEATAGPVIVYASTIKSVETAHDALRAAGTAAGRYHGRLGSRERREQQDAFMRGDLRVMVATNAFGLGIDRADVRAVVHFQMPGGLDAYYQESGRAGRDGEDARCILLYLERDKSVQRFFLAGRYPAFEDVEATYLKLLEAPADGAAWSLDALVDVLDRPRNKVQVALVLLRRERVVVKRKDGTLAVQRGKLDGAAVERLLAGYRAKREHDRAMLEQMAFYGLTGHCRWQVLLKHFDDASTFERCGSCDNCARIALAQTRAANDEGTTGEAVEQRSVEVAFADGDPVRVRRYGAGIVRAADARQVTVEFPSGDTRSFLASFVEKRSGRRKAA